MIIRSETEGCCQARASSRASRSVPLFGFSDLDPISLAGPSVQIFFPPPLSGLSLFPGPCLPQTTPRFSSLSFCSPFLFLFFLLFVRSFVQRDTRARTSFRYPWWPDSSATPGRWKCSNQNLVARSKRCDRLYKGNKDNDKHINYLRWRAERPGRGK